MIQSAGSLDSSKIFSTIRRSSSATVPTGAEALTLRRYSMKDPEFGTEWQTLLRPRPRMPLVIRTQLTISSIQHSQPKDSESASQKVPSIRSPSSAAFLAYSLMGPCSALPRPTPQGG